MASYKVAQDVEADDKLLGPFTARQFIYLVVVAMAAAMAFFLGQLFFPLAIIPLPVILFFGALALPLHRDQPMEVYLAAIVSYNLKPRRRLWVPDGITSLVEIVAPQVEEKQLTKTFTQTEAEQRLSYLADIVDTQGWAVRHVATGTSMISDVYNTAQATSDVLDTTGTVAQNFDMMLDQADQKHRQAIINQMHSPAPTAAPAPAPAPAPTQQWYSNPYAALAAAPTQQPAPAPQPAPAMPSDLHFNPYPNSIHQSVIQPMSADDQIVNTTPAAPEPVATPTAAAPEPAKSTSETTVTPDIMNLVNNSDLSIETIAREAHRIKDKDDEEEVVISLR